MIKRLLPFAFSVSLIAGLLLRNLWIDDMEYKADEQRVFELAIESARSGVYPQFGIPSGVNLLNPGLSVWVFSGLAKLFALDSPLELCRAVVLSNCLALLLLAIFSVRIVNTVLEREIWAWTTALAAVNPIGIVYQRKIWAQSILPLASVTFLICWWKREHWWPAFFWGFLGACLGQIHMTGFFFAGGFALWTAIARDRRTRWGAWVIGSTIALPPLLPWIAYFVDPMRSTSDSTALNLPWSNQFWEYGIGNGFGLHLGFFVGSDLGSGVFKMNSEFLPYPLIFGVPTYGVGILYSLIAAILVVFLSSGLGTLVRNLRSLLQRPIANGKLALLGVFLGFGPLLTLSGVWIRRYYWLVAFPFDSFAVARMAYSIQRPSVRQALLTILWFTHFLMSVLFLVYVHEKGGAPNGDYGVSYRLQIDPIQR